MKIIYCTDQIYLHGGIERVLTNKVNYWVEEKGYEVHIITTEQVEKQPCYSTNKKVNLHDLGINYNRSKSFFHPINFKKTPKHFNLLKMKINEIKPDVVVVCNLAPDFYFLPFIFKKILKIKEIHASRCFQNKNPKGVEAFKKKLNDFIESKYHYLALLTQDEKEYYKSNNTIVIPNALSSYSKEKSLLDGKKVISAGRITPIKGFDKLIESWKLINQKHPDWELNIFGQGEENYINELKDKLETLGISDCVFFRGQTNQLKKEMIESSIYAMSSLTECFPMVLLEALSVGLPVVSFDCPNGPRNIIRENEDGILVEDQNNTEIAEGIIRLISNEKLRKNMGEKGIKNIQRFQSEKVMNMWDDLFKNKR